MFTLKHKRLVFIMVSFLLETYRQLMKKIALLAFPFRLDLLFLFFSMRCLVKHADAKALGLCDE